MINEKQLYEKTLEYFNGDNIAANVWIKKYRDSDEFLPQDRFDKISKEFGETLYEMLEDTKKKLSNKELSNLSVFGDSFFRPLLTNNTKEKCVDFFKQRFGFEHALGGGSVLQGIGRNNFSSLSNCFVLGQPFDSYSGIIEKEHEFISVMKRRGGGGVDVSTIRPKYAPVNNQATSSTGPMLFVQRYNNGTKEVAQDARRGALMVTINILHPDSLDFITAKQKEGELSSINMSVQLDNSFMQAVEHSEEIYLRFPCNIPIENFQVSTYSLEKQNEIEMNKLIPMSYCTKKYGENSETKTGYIRKVSAKTYWNTIIDCAWKMAEPGLMFSDNHDNYSPDTVYQEYRAITSNPCFGGETMLNCIDGYKSFEELNKLGDFKLSLSIKEGDSKKNWFTAFVSSATNEDLYELVFEDFVPKYPIIVTKNHKFPVYHDGEIFVPEDEVQNLIGKKLSVNSDKKYAILSGLKFVRNDKTYNFTVINGPNYGIVSEVVCCNCGEIRMQAYDSCRLLAENMLASVKNKFQKDSEFDIKAWYINCYYQQITADVLVQLESKYIDMIIGKLQSSNDPKELKDLELNLWYKIKNTCLSSRRTGSGFLALGDTLAALGLNYGDKKSLEVVDKIFNTKMKAELNASIDLAIVFEPFKGWNPDFEYWKESDGSIKFGANHFYQSLLDMFPEEINRMYKFGRRNVSWSTAAPTGSQSILTQTTSGIEPLFLPWYDRRVKCINETDRVDFVDVDGQKFTVYYVLHHQFKYWIENVYKYTGDISKISEKELTTIFKESPWYGNCAADISYKQRIQVQKIVQQYTSHSISSTINLPNNIDKQTIANIYFESWINGLKGQTVYRDGCRKGVIVSSGSDKINQIEETFRDINAPKRPISLLSHYYNFECRGKHYSIIIGLMNNRPYEIFIISEINCMPELLDDTQKLIGYTTKEARNIYLFEEINDNFILTNLQDAEHEEKEIGLMLSTMLRHGVSVKFVVKVLNKSMPIAGSFTYKLSKILMSYIPNGTESGEKCPECGKKIIFDNGCKRCVCGYSAC